ncbi:hypothetical protein Abr02nite_73850 [Paractinoplanes brasiliensis]|nr:hypothetical protein Abr02nite_73850 [Actinoplanes brasiliensis]
MQRPLLRKLNGMREALSRPVATAALTVAAGATDLLALTVLGGAFASIVTGNLIMFGYGISTTDPHRVIPAAVAVLGYAAGVLIWSWIWRSRPTAVRGPLIAELVLLVIVAAGLVMTGEEPAIVPARLLLAGAAVAMGGQSTVGLRLGAATTYMTGLVATTTRDQATGRHRAVAPTLFTLTALVAGSAAAAAFLAGPRWPAALLEPVMVGTAIVLLPAKIETAGPNAPAPPARHLR